MGKSNSVEKDHKPLVPLLSTHTLVELPPKIQTLNATEIPLQEDQGCYRKEDVHSRCTFKTPNRKPNNEVDIDNNKNHTHIGSVISSLPA